MLLSFYNSIFMLKLNNFFRKLNQRKVFGLLFVLMMSSMACLHAQTDIAKYRLTKTTETYTPITGGTVFIASAVPFDQEISAAITIPNFNYGGVNVNTVFVHANGYLTFGAAHSGTTYTPLSTAGTNVTGVIAAFAADLGYSSGSATTNAASEIRYLQAGDEFIVQYADVKRWNIANERISYQIRLNTATGVVKIIYGGTIVIGNTTTGLQVGIRGNSNAWASNVNNLMIDNIPAATTCNWNEAVTGNANSSTLYTSSANNNIIPTAGLCFTWTPATAPAPVRAFSAVTGLTSTSATITWTAATGATQYNVQYRIPGSCAWTNFSGNPVTGVTANLTGLFTATSYQVRVLASNGTTNSIWSHSPDAAGSGNGYTLTGTFTTLCTTPAPGATLASATNNLCAGTPVAFSLTTPTPGPGVSYQWQSSPDNLTFTNISGATAASYTAAPTAKFIRCMVKCSSGPDSTASTPVQLNFLNSILTTTPATRCGIGTVNLAATGNTGTTVRWYAAQTGGLPIGSNVPFTTPTINATTNYFAGAESIATGTVTMGTGTSSTGTTSYPNPLSAYYGGTKHQLLFLASELAGAGLAAGNITTLSFDLAAVNTAGICNDFTIRMGATSATALTGFEAGTAPVYNASYTPTAAGIVTFTLTTPYNWNGTSNIIVETVHNAGNGGNGSGTTHRYTTTPFNSVYVRYADNVTPATAAGFDASTAGTVSAYANRPNVIFGGQQVCSSPRVAVTATVTPGPTFTITPGQTICNNAVTPLTVTSTLANYNTYTWSPVTGLFTDAAATVAYTAGSNASTVYLKSNTAGAVSYTVNANNTTSLCAAMATTDITILPSAVTSQAIAPSLCVSGVTTLSLLPATGYGAATFQWQSATTNIVDSFVNVSGATNPVYTTPTTTSNTFYRAVIKNSAGAVCLNSSVDTARVYAPAVTTTAPASRCGPGTLTLGATGVDGTLRWYAAATGGTSLGSGTSYTTPSLTATTTYYVSAENVARGTATIGAGASTTISSTSTADKISPFDHYYGGFKSQNLITVAELTAAGLNPGYIYSVAFDVVAGGGLFQGFNMSIGTTTAAVLTTTPVGGLTTVFTTTAPAGLTTPASGLCVVTFATPFLWDGTSNLVIQTCWSNNNGGGTGTTVKYDATSYVSHNYYQADSQTPSSICGGTTATTLSNRPKMVINGTAICASTPRTPVIATVNAIPNAVVTPAGPVQVCAGNSATLTVTGGGTYKWLNAAGLIAGQTSSTYSTGTAGIYKAIATSTANCIDTSDAVTVVVNPLPVVFIGNDTTFCSGNTLTLNAGNNGAVFLWDNATTSQTRPVTASGNYFVKVTNSNNCFKYDTIAVVVNPTPVVNLGGDTTVCAGINLVLNSGNPAANRVWDNGTAAQLRTVSASGTYYVKVTNSFNCSANDTATVTFLPAPVVNLGSNLDICAGSSAILNAGNPTGTFVWDNGTTQQTRTVNTSGTYYVTVSNAAMNCKGSDTIQVTVHANPVVNLGNDTVFCYGNTLTLNAGNPGAAYLWNDNTTNQTLNASTTGNYSVVVTDAYSCVGTDAINILVKDPPSGLINAVYGDTATYRFNILEPRYVTSYTWNFGDGTPLVTGPVVFHTFANNGVYNVTVTLGGECADSTGKSRTVDVFDGRGTTGIHRLDDDKALVVYPNPASEFITIENKLNLKMKQVSVFNVLGQLIMTEKANTPDKHVLHTKSLATGIYTVSIETEKGIVIRKFEVRK